MILGPFGQEVSSTLTLTNPSERKVCFKFKTTAPNAYTLSPNQGLINPREEVMVKGNMKKITKTATMMI